MIRAMKQADKEIYMELSRQFYNTDVVYYKVPDANFVKTFDLIMGGSPYADGFMFEFEGEIAGYAIVSISYSNEAGGLVLWIEEIYILEQFRGKGLGGAYFKFLDDKYGKTVASMRLEVTATNEKAIKMYMGKGFEVLKYGQMIKFIKG